MKKKLLSGVTTLALALTLTLPAAAAESDFLLTNGGADLGGYTGPGGEVVIPSSLGIDIIWNAFQGNTEITSVTIPEGVSAIQVGGFADCTALEQVSLPHSLRSIGPAAFAGCTSLREVTIPEGVTSISQGAFKGCTSLERLSLPSTLRSIDQNAFTGCTSLEELIIPEGVTDIESFAFQGCTSLEKAVIPASVTEMGIDLFEGCTNLTEVIIGGRTIPIGEGNKKDNTLVATTDELSKVFVIEDNMKVNGGKTMDRVLTRYLGEGGHVVVPDGVKALGGLVFRDRTDITSITLPEGLERIDGYAFSGCSGLTEIDIPDSVTYLGADVFSGTSLTELDLPAGLTEQDQFALGGCRTLKKITFNSPMPSLRDGALSQMKYLFGGDTALEEIVNLPNRELQARWDANRAAMEQWVNPADQLKPQSQRITDQAAQIVGSLENDRDKALEIFYWVTSHVDYDWDYYNKVKSTVASEPEAVLDSGLAVCEGYARLTQALLQAIGIPAMYVTGIADGAGVGTGPHAWVEAYVDGRWMLIDPTFGDGFFGLDYFDPTLLSFSCDHQIGWRSAASEEDTPSGWAIDEVDAALRAKLVPNDLQSSYRENITREEFCRLMVNMVEQSASVPMEQYLARKGLSLTSPFTDTDSPAVLAAYALGVVNGSSPTTFNPGGSITRQEAAAMLARTAGVLGLSTGAPIRFADEAQLASWAGGPVAFVSGLQDPISGSPVMGGVGGRFDPAAPYTREQAVLTTLRLFHCAD